MEEPNTQQQDRKAAIAKCKPPRTPLYQREAKKTSTGKCEKKAPPRAPLIAKLLARKSRDKSGQHLPSPTFQHCALGGKGGDGAALRYVFAIGGFFFALCLRNLLRQPVLLDVVCFVLRPVSGSLRCPCCRRGHCTVCVLVVSSGAFFSHLPVYIVYAIH